MATTTNTISLVKFFVESIITKINYFNEMESLNALSLNHGNHIGMETLFQIDKNTYAEKELTNSQEKELSNSLYWLIKTSRQVVIFICRQTTNLLIRLSS